MATEGPPIIMTLPPHLQEGIPDGYELVPVDRITDEYEIVPWKQVKTLLNITIGQINPAAHGDPHAPNKHHLGGSYTPPPGSYTPPPVTLTPKPPVSYPSSTYAPPKTPYKEAGYSKDNYLPALKHHDSYPTTTYAPPVTHHKEVGYPSTTYAPPVTPYKEIGYSKDNYVPAFKHHNEILNDLHVNEVIKQHYNPPPISPDLPTLFYDDLGQIKHMPKSKLPGLESHIPHHEPPAPPKSVKGIKTYDPRKNKHNYKHANTNVMHFGSDFGPPAVKNPHINGYKVSTVPPPVPPFIKQIFPKSTTAYPLWNKSPSTPKPYYASTTPYSKVRYSTPQPTTVKSLPKSTYAPKHHPTPYKSTYAPKVHPSPYSFNPTASPSTTLSSLKVSPYGTPIPHAAKDHFSPLPTSIKYSTPPSIDYSSPLPTTVKFTTTHPSKSAKSYQILNFYTTPKPVYIPEKHDKPHIEPYHPPPIKDIHHSTTPVPIVHHEPHVEVHQKPYHPPKLDGVHIVHAEHVHPEHHEPYHKPQVTTIKPPALSFHTQSTIKPYHHSPAIKLAHSTTHFPHPKKHPTTIAPQYEAPHTPSLPGLAVHNPYHDIMTHPPPKHHHDYVHDIVPGHHEAVHHEAVHHHEPVHPKPVHHEPYHPPKPPPQHIGPPSHHVDHHPTVHPHHPTVHPTVHSHHPTVHPHHPTVHPTVHSHHPTPSVHPKGEPHLPPLPEFPHGPHHSPHGPHPPDYHHKKPKVHHYDDYNLPHVEHLHPYHKPAHDHPHPPHAHPHHPKPHKPPAYGYHYHPKHYSVPESAVSHLPSKEKSFLPVGYHSIYNGPGIPPKYPPVPLGEPPSYPPRPYLLGLNRTHEKVEKIKIDDVDALKDALQKAGVGPGSKKKVYLVKEKDGETHVQISLPVDELFEDEFEDRSSEALDITSLGRSKPTETTTRQSTTRRTTTTKSTTTTTRPTTTKITATNRDSNLVQLLGPKPTSESNGKPEKLMKFEMNDFWLQMQKLFKPGQILIADKKGNKKLKKILIAKQEDEDYEEEYNENEYEYEDYVTQRTQNVGAKEKKKSKLKMNLQKMPANQIDQLSQLLKEVQGNSNIEDVPKQDQINLIVVGNEDTFMQRVRPNPHNNVQFPENPRRPGQVQGLLAPIPGSGVRGSSDDIQGLFAPIPGSGVRQPDNTQGLFAPIPGSGVRHPDNTQGLFAPIPGSGVRKPDNTQGFIPPFPGSGVRTPENTQGFIPPLPGSGVRRPENTQGFIPPLPGSGVRRPENTQGFVPPIPGSGVRRPENTQGFSPPIPGSGVRRPENTQGFIPPIPGSGVRGPENTQGFSPPIPGSGVRRPENTDGLVVPNQQFFQEQLNQLNAVPTSRIDISGEEIDDTSTVKDTSSSESNLLIVTPQPQTTTITAYPTSTQTTSTTESEAKKVLESLRSTLDGLVNTVEGLNSTVVDAMKEKSKEIMKEEPSEQVRVMQIEVARLTKMVHDLRVQNEQNQQKQNQNFMSLITQTQNMLKRQEEKDRVEKVKPTFVTPSPIQLTPSSVQERIPLQMDF